MCGRYDLSDNPAAIKAKFKVAVVPDFSANPDLRPTNSAPVVRRAHGSDEREVALLRWGLVPSWARDLKFGARCINARAETLASTPSFRSAYRKRRCLVPLNAFFEWSGVPGHKVKWRIGLKDEPLFALAGLWEWWKDPATERGIETYTIVTTRANELIAPIHDRMPVVITERDHDRWLNADDPATDLLEPLPDDALQVAKA
ncbi:MAG TPA: SOS response-associated peptidase [Burkholderiaceae bacterium]|nr:SOS response-associated peptidase [Burkholderiaceae bacterium]